MARATRTALAVGLGGACLLAGAPASPAEAAPLVTQLVDLLTVSVATPAAALTTTGLTASGSLGTTTVVDARVGASGYDVSVSTAGFDLVGALLSTSATHLPPSAASVRATNVTGGTPSSTASVTLPSALVFRVVYSGLLSGLVNFTSTYTMSMTINIPAAAAAGAYRGTVTQTVA